MPSQINDSNWCGPNAAGQGGTPAPGSADDGYGMHGQVWSGPATLGLKYAITGPYVAGAAPAATVVVDGSGTHVY
jgi:hypothetical protein